MTKILSSGLYSHIGDLESLESPMTFSYTSFRKINKNYLLSSCLVSHIGDLDSPICESEVVMTLSYSSFRKMKIDLTLILLVFTYR